MPNFTITHHLAMPPDAVFSFLTTTANLPRLIPPDVSLELLEAPATLRQGERLTWKGRRWGISQRFVVQVRECVEPSRIVQVQEQGPFARWEQEQYFEADGDGTRLIESVTFDPPGGLLGRFLSADKIQADLQTLYAYRGEQLRKLLTVLPGRDQ